MPIDRLNIALEASGVGIWDWRPDTGAAWWSANLPDVLGVNRDAIDGTFETFLALVVDEDRAGVTAAVTAALREGGTYETEFRIEGRDGRVRWIRGQGRVTLDREGNAIRVIGAVLDITSRRDAEAAELAFVAIARASEDAIIAVDMDGIVTAWNVGAERLYGYLASEMVGQHVQLLIPSERTGEFRIILDRLLSGERVSNFETVRLTKDGRQVYVSISSGLLVDADGNAFGAASIARDITDRRREEEWQRFLAEASRLLGDSLDIDQTLTSVAHLCTAALADWCTVHTRNAGGEVELVAIAHRDPAQVEWAVAVTRRFPYDDSAPTGVPNVFRTGLPEHYPVIDDALLTAAIEDPEILAIFREIRLSSAIIVPMIVRGQTIGVIAIYAAQPGRHFSEQDLAMAMDLAGRAAHALDNARSYAKAAAAERQLRLIADNLPALVSYVDRDERYGFVNRRYAEWFGSSRQDLIGRPISDLFQPDDYAGIAECLARGFRGEPVSYEMELDYPAAGRRQVDVRYVPDIDESGKTRGLVSLILDIGDRVRERRRSSLLQHLTETVASAASAGEVARAMVTDGRVALGASAASVALLDSNTGVLTVLAVEGFPDDVVVGSQFSVNDGTAFGLVAATGEPILLNTWAERLRLFPHHERVVLPRNRGSFFAVPLLVEEQTIGVLMATYSDERQLEQTEAEFVFTLASICAQALDRARLFDAERLARAQAEVESARHALLADVSEILGGGLGPRPDLEPVARLIARDVADWCVIDLLDGKRNLARECVVHRDPSRAAAAARLKDQYPALGAGRPHTIWSVLESGRARFDPAMSRDRFRAEARDGAHYRILDELGYAGEMVVPLRARGRSLGAITYVRSDDARPFMLPDLRLAEELTGRVALALDNARLLAQSQASEARYRELFEGVADAILVIDREGVIQEVNSSGCRLLRRVRAELIGRPIGEVAGLESFEPGLAALARSGEPAELTIDHGDGLPVVVEAHAGEVELPGGTIYLAGLRDVTARHALDRLRRDFLAMVTHDLRSPLAALRVQAQLMHRRREYNGERVEAIIGQTDRMARLIDGLADVMRMDSGQLELRRERVELGDLVRGAVAQERMRAPNRRIDVVTGAPVLGDWDGDRLFQVIANLVGNAINYSPEGTTITVRVCESISDGIIEVQDRGHGIAPEHVGKLFDRFYRAEVTGAGGLGLGLYIARLLVEAHGGTISVESVVGAGTTFTVRLPRVTDGEG